MVCCKSCTSPSCKQEEAEWAKYDTDCVLQGGTCQFNSVPCNGYDLDYRPQFNCGGPSDRQCCAPNVKPTPTVSSTQTIPTVAPTPKPTVPSSSGNGGQTAGIVIGVLIGCCFVVGAGYYVMQNGNPLSNQQQSFANVNSADNTEGNIDGYSNPLAGGDSGSSDDNPNMGGGDTFNMATESSVVPEVVAPEVVNPVPATSDFDEFANLGPAPSQPTDPVVTLDVPSDSLI